MAKTENWSIPESRFDNLRYIERRVSQAETSHQGRLKSLLKYLYLTEGPRNLPRNAYKTAEIYLSPSEDVAVRWLKSRTNGSARKLYGYNALKAVRESRLRCANCGNSDVRVLQLDHKKKKLANKSKFTCLCANCHQIKSRLENWMKKKSRKR